MRFTGWVPGRAAARRRAVPHPSYVVQVDVAAAAAETVVGLLADPRGRNAVLTARAWARGEATVAGCRAAEIAARELAASQPSGSAQWLAARACAATAGIARNVSETGRAIGFASMARTATTPDAAPASSSASSFVVRRQDDHGNVYDVSRHPARDEAQARADELEARAHKQTYWVTESPG